MEIQKPSTLPPLTKLRGTQVTLTHTKARVKETEQDWDQASFWELVHHVFYICMAKDSQRGWFKLSLWGYFVLLGFCILVIPIY
jgi:hypothetical protein